MKVFLFSFLIVAFIYELHALEEVCPQTDIKPCTCKTYVDGACIIACGLANQKDIDRLADIPNLCNGHIHFMLVHSKIAGIPAKLWKVLLTSKTVDVYIKNAAVERLVTGDESMSNLRTPGEAAIKVDSSKVGWNWNRLRDFYSEQGLTLVIDDSPLLTLDEDFAHLGGDKVHKVSLDSTELTTIRDDQFVAFDDLSSLSLQNNRLTQVSRSMLARPAKNLKFLHFNGNFLTTLPEDLFAEMPSLRIVYLRNNKFKSLPVNLFLSVAPSLKQVDLVQNPWECDCSLLTMFRTSKVYLNMGTCASPDSLAQLRIPKLGEMITC